MKLLNLGCGYPRIEGDEWTNVDTLLAQLPEGSPERANLAAETNYIEHDITMPFPFCTETFDGILCSHVLEHFDCHRAVRIMVECRRVLKIGGTFLISVPNATYFRLVYPDDRVQNWPRLFDVTDHENPISTFFEAALWFDQHKVLFTQDVLWCYLKRAGFTNWTGDLDLQKGEAINKMIPHLNRRRFSIEVAATKNTAI